MSIVNIDNNTKISDVTSKINNNFTDFKDSFFDEDEGKLPETESFVQGRTTFYWQGLANLLSFSTYDSEGTQLYSFPKMISDFWKNISTNIETLAHIKWKDGDLFQGGYSISQKITKFIIESQVVGFVNPYYLSAYENDVDFVSERDVITLSNLEEVTFSLNTESGISWPYVGKVLLTWLGTDEILDYSNYIPMVSFSDEQLQWASISDTCDITTEEGKAYLIFKCTRPFDGEIPSVVLIQKNT